MFRSTAPCALKITISWSLVCLFWLSFSGKHSCRTLITPKYDFMHLNILWIYYQWKYRYLATLKAQILPASNIAFPPRYSLKIKYSESSFLRVSLHTILFALWIFQTQLIGSVLRNKWIMYHVLAHMDKKKGLEMK